MGKTESGAVWLDKSLLSPYDYWQFLEKYDDRDVIKFSNVCTWLKKLKKLKTIILKN